MRLPWDGFRFNNGGKRIAVNVRVVQQQSLGNIHDQRAIAINAIFLRRCGGPVVDGADRNRDGCRAKRRLELVAGSVGEAVRAAIVCVGRIVERSVGVKQKRSVRWPVDQVGGQYVVFVVNVIIKHAIGRADNECGVFVDFVGVVVDGRSVVDFDQYGDFIGIIACICGHIGK